MVPPGTKYLGVPDRRDTGTRYATKRGKEVGGGHVSPMLYLRYSRATVTCPARRKGLQLLSSFVYYFSLSSLDRPSMGANVGRFERFIFLFLALFGQAFCFCFLGQ